MLANVVTTLAKVPNESLIEAGDSVRRADLSLGFGFHFLDSEASCRTLVANFRDISEDLLSAL